METRKHCITYREFSSLEELPHPYDILFDKALKAIESSYAPYSNFNVGAAVLMGNGVVVTGSNQENAASPSGLCAERVALFSAHHQFPSESVEAIAIVAKHKGHITEELTYPCAACVQVMIESQKRSGKPIKIMVGSATKVHIMDSVDDLAPFSFGK